MTVRLSVHRAPWTAHVEQVAAAYGPSMVPVVKGNGYGFGRTRLHALAGRYSREVCVGTVHELAEVPAELTAVVLTPTLTPPASDRAVLTVGAGAHVAALQGWRGAVLLKLASSMRRYGVDPYDLPELRRQAERAGLAVVGYSLHLPLAGTDDARRREVDGWLSHLDPQLPLWLSHLAPPTFADLVDDHPTRSFRIRVGTLLWHGSPRGEFLRLSADVLSTRTVAAGDVAGYHHREVPFNGTLIAIGAGTAHGVVALAHDDPAQRSPFHFARRRLELLEHPHMHTSLVVVPRGVPTPEVGDRVDVQRPLHTTHVDELVVDGQHLDGPTW